MAVPAAPTAQRSPDELRTILRRLPRSPAAWFFGAVWLLSVLYLLTAGQGGMAVRGMINLAAVLLLGAVTVRVTAGGPPPEPNPEPTSQPEPGADRAPWRGRAGRRVAVQLAFVVLAVLYTMAAGMAFHGNLPAWLGWLPLIDGLPPWQNGLLYFVIPVLGLLALGARWRELGLARGHRVLAALAVWCALPAAAILYALLTGGLTIGALGRRLVGNFIYNGFFEEFLFRGALETRLMRLLRHTDWAVVLSALAFGIWHLGLNAGITGGYLTGLAAGIATHAATGLGFSILFQRTRNLLAPSVFHILGNSVG